MIVSRAAMLGAAILILATAACSGGGSKSSPSAPSPSPTPVATPAPLALWIANGSNVVEYTPTQLAAGNAAPVPHLSLNSAAFGAPQGVTFDAAGNLWVIDGGTLGQGGTAKPALYKFTPAQLTAALTSPAQMPSTTLAATGFTFPQQAVFDKSGNLWVTDNGAGVVDVFSPAQLAGGGSVVPAAVVSSSVAFAGPLGIAFDAGGDLFVANNAGTSIEGFAASSLPASGAVTITPNVVLSDDGANSVQAPWALVFDANGNLWSSNANPPSTVVEFTKSELSGTAAKGPVPPVTLLPAMSGTNLTLAAPNGLAFDNAGNLAVISSAAPFGAAIFAKSQLTAAGATVPGTFIVGGATTLSAPAGDVFGPVVQ